MWPVTAGVLVCRPVRRTGGRAPREEKRKNQIGSAVLALDAVLKRNCEWTEMREFRRKQRNLEVIVFLWRAGVKDNREFFSTVNGSEERLFFTS